MYFTSVSWLKHNHIFILANIYMQRQCFLQGVEFAAALFSQLIDYSVAIYFDS